MKIKQFINQFIIRYSAQSSIERLEKLILDIKESIKNTGNSFYKLLLICFLLFLIGIKRAIIFFRNFWATIIEIAHKFYLFLKRLSNSFIELIRLIYQFIRKVFILALVEEIAFYYRKLSEFSSELKNTLTEIVDKLSDYSDYLSKKMDNEDITFTPINKEPYAKLIGKSFLYLCITITWLLCSLFMTVLLTIIVFTMFPVLHQYIRKELLNVSDNYSN